MSNGKEQTKACNLDRGVNVVVSSYSLLTWSKSFRSHDMEGITK